MRFPRYDRSEARISSVAARCSHRRAGWQIAALVLCRARRLVVVARRRAAA